MQTRALRSLVRISQVGSFLKAAEQLNMTLSALSMQMKALEGELGVALFDRTVRPPRLTPMGRAVVDKAAELLTREDDLVALCARDDDLVGRFRMGFVTSAAARLLPDFLDNTQRVFPRAAFDFETGLSVVLQDRVRSGALDAAVITGAETAPPGLQQRVLRDEPLVFAAHRAMAEEGLDRLIARRSFFHFMPHTGIGKLIAVAMAQFARPAGCTTVTLDNIEAIIGCVRNRLGFTLLPEADVARHANGDLAILPSPIDIRRLLVLVVRGDHMLANRVGVLAAQCNAPTGAGDVAGPATGHAPGSEGRTGPWP